jgi:hypothetical protein
MQSQRTLYSGELRKDILCILRIRQMKSASTRDPGDRIHQNSCTEIFFPEESNYKLTNLSFVQEELLPYRVYRS